MMFNILLQSISALLIGATGSADVARDQYPTEAQPVIKFSSDTQKNDTMQICLNGTVSGEYAIPAANSQGLVVNTGDMHNVSGVLTELSGDFGIASVSCAQNFKVTLSDQNAYAATATVDNSKLILTKVPGYNADMVFAAGTGLVLYGPKDTQYTITPVSDNNTTSITANALMGTIAHTTPGILKTQNTPAANQELLLLFYNKSGKVFQPYDGTFIPQGKAFVPMVIDTQSNSRNISLDIESDVTALDMVTIDEIEIIDDATYDLSGRKADNSNTGIVINNGKLIIIK